MAGMNRRHGYGHSSASVWYGVMLTYVIFMVTILPSLAESGNSHHGDSREGREGRKKTTPVGVGEPLHSYTHAVDTLHTTSQSHKGDNEETENNNQDDNRASGRRRCAGRRRQWGECEEEETGVGGAVFPQMFSVMTGTTIVMRENENIAQGGMIYFDLSGQRMRIDNWYLDFHQSFLARYDEKRVYMITNGKCVYSTVKNGTLLPYDVPPGSVRHSEFELVRSTVVHHYEAVVAAQELTRVDFYVVPLNRTLSHHIQRSDQQKRTLHAPWRTIYRRSRRRELPPGEGSVETSDEEDLSNYQPFGTSVAALEEVSRVITDYYNFNPSQQDPNLFAPPQGCTRSTEESVFTPFEGEDLYDDQIIRVHKRLVDISLFEGERRFLAGSVPQEPKCSKKEGAAAAAAAQATGTGSTVEEKQH